MSEWSLNPSAATPVDPSELAAVVANSELVVEATNLSFFSEPGGVGAGLRRLNRLREARSTNPTDYEPSSFESQTHNEEMRLRTSFDSLQLRENPVFLDRSKLCGFVEISSENQVVTVQAGCTIGGLNTELSKYGLCVPYFGLEAWGYESVQIGVALEWNYPNLRGGTHGTWRDWLLEAHVILADGSDIKSGSKVVKSVSGYDLHKLLVGSRGTLGVTHEVTLRVSPLGVSPLASVTSTSSPNFVGESEYTMYQRVKPTDYAQLIEHLNRFAPGYWSDSTGCQVCANIDLENAIRFDDDVVFHAEEGFSPIPTTGEVALMKRAKNIFDPLDKLNPGEFRFL